MITISLRYTDRFAPQNGTIVAHNDIIKRKGFVWYEKMGAIISKKTAKIILSNPEPRFLLIHSGTVDRYWMYFSYDCPPKDEFPHYYHDIASNFMTWFRVIRIENAEKNIMSKCRVLSSGSTLTEASKHSMSPYFIVFYDE